MTTAAMAHEEDSLDDNVERAAQAAIRFTVDSTRAIGNLIPKGGLQNLTTPKYTMPDKTVASQVLMYRQLLHTSCKPGLRLSRPYEGTPAQRAVLHMPWWEQGIEETGKMVISYDNLIVRLWLNGAIMPHTQTDLLNIAAESSIKTLIDDKGLPPVPHEYWVARLGFQQEDPVTDFRSGGVLSLALLVYLVESCPSVLSRFYGGGDAAVLPFALTGINVVDMMAKFLMLTKSVDKVEALMSSKPFWRMFGDPNAILALQEISMNMIADVVVEMGRERKIPGLVPSEGESLHGENQGKVTVFDFPQILERTEARVRDDLLGAGPKTVEELRSIAARLKVKYQKALERKERRAALKEQAPNKPPMAFGGFVGGMWNTIRTPLKREPSEEVNFDPPPAAKEAENKAPTTAYSSAAADAAPATASAPAPDLLTPNSFEAQDADEDDAVLIDHVGNFKIDDDEDDDDGIL